MEHTLLHHARRTFECNVLGARILAKQWPHMRHVPRELEPRIIEGSSQGILGVSHQFRRYLQLQLQGKKY